MYIPLHLVIILLHQVLFFFPISIQELFLEDLLGTNTMIGVVAISEVMPKTISFSQNFRFQIER